MTFFSLSASLATIVATKVIQCSIHPNPQFIKTSLVLQTNYFYPYCNSTGQSICEYSQDYGDGSYSKGNTALETFTLGSTEGGSVPFPNIIIGYGHKNSCNFFGDSSRVVGRGGGAASLISQLHPSIGDKFSYCLVPYFNFESTSKLNFGEKCCDKLSCVWTVINQNISFNFKTQIN